MRPFNYYWRLFATGLGYTVFGLGALSITFTVFPLIHLLSFNRRRANRGCQYVVHLAFRFFIWLMAVSGVLSHDIKGAEKLRHGGGKIIVANHPTLLDIVFLASLLPFAVCVVKKAAWSNPFLAGLMLATGFIKSDDPFDFIDDCVEVVRQGDNLLIFPEATRTVPGEPLKLKRAAASVIARCGTSFVLVIITCDPSTLSKADKWYEIPNRKMHFRITVKDRIDPGPRILEGEQLSKTSRRLNTLLIEHFTAGIEEHGRTG